jgi:hypothetical protein
MKNMLPYQVNHYSVTFRGSKYCTPEKPIQAHQIDLESPLTEWDWDS